MVFSISKVGSKKGFRSIFTGLTVDDARSIDRRIAIKPA